MLQEKNAHEQPFDIVPQGYAATGERINCLIPIRIQDGDRGVPRAGLRRRTSWYVEAEQTEGQRRYTLKSTLYGETPEAGRHGLLTDVKAVTLHRFSLKQAEKGWKAFVILDI